MKHLDFKFLYLLLLLAINSHVQANDTPLQADTLHIRKLIEESRQYQWREPNRSFLFADSAFQLSQKLNYQKGIALAQVLRGFAYWAFGDNELAIASAMESLEIAQLINLSAVEAESYYILSRGYMDVNQNEQASTAVRQAEAIASRDENWQLLISIYNLRGVVLFINQQTDSALYYYQKAYDLGKRQQVDPINFVRIISNIGECYEEKNPSLAYNYYTQALALAKETGNKIGEASIYDILGHSNIRRKDLKKAEEYLLTSLQLARKLGLRRVIRHSYSGLVNIKLQQGKGDEAVVYQRKFYDVRDSLINVSKIRQIVELEAKHDLQLQKQSIQLLEKEKRIQILWRNILAAIIFLIFIAFIVIYQWQRYRHRKNREMLNLEIDYLTRQHMNTVDKLKASLSVERDERIESLDQKLLKQAVAVVEAHISNPQFGVEIMAEEMNMSRTNLHRKIKSITGFPPSELIRSIRLRKAAKLIAHHADTVTQIAQMVGFDDYSHFSKAFKKHFGVSPSAYEEQNKSIQLVE